MKFSENRPVKIVMLGLEQGYFTMVLLVDISACTVSFPEIADKLDAYGTERGLAVRIQREDIFNAMHRI